MPYGGVVCARPLARLHATEQAGFTAGPSHPRRRSKGFTLVELMVVVSIIAVVAVVAARSFSRNRRGGSAQSFARGALLTFHQARQSSMATHASTRIRIVLTPPALIAEQQDPTPGSTTWLPLSTLVAPSEIQLCAPDYTTGLAAISPTCPASSDMAIQYTNGVMQVANASGTTVCPSGGGTAACAAGVSFPFQSADGGQRYKVFVYGLTGLPRLMDAW